MDSSQIKKGSDLLSCLITYQSFISGLRASSRRDQVLVHEVRVFLPLIEQCIFFFDHFIVIACFCNLIIIHLVHLINFPRSNYI